MKLFSYTLCLSSSLYCALTLYLTKPLNKQFMFFPLVCIHFGFHEIFTKVRKNVPFFLLVFLAVIYSTTRIFGYVQFFYPSLLLVVVFVVVFSRRAWRWSSWLWGKIGFSLFLVLLCFSFEVWVLNWERKNVFHQGREMLTLHNFTFVMQNTLQSIYKNVFNLNQR